MLKLSPTSENLRYLLWREGIKQEDWGKHLADWAKCSEVRAEDLLNGKTLQSDEQRRIAERAKVREEQIQNERFLGDQVDVLQQNILFLTDKAVTGFAANVIAREINISPATISRWRKTKQTPEETQLLKLCRFYGFPQTINLREDAIFLSMSPVGDLKRRAWLQKCIEQIDAETLNALYPALEKLLK